MDCAVPRSRRYAWDPTGRTTLNGPISFVVELDGWASCLYVAAIDHDEGTRSKGVVGASVGVGVCRVTFVSDSNEVGSGFVDGGEGGSVL